MKFLNKKMSLLKIKEWLNLKKIKKLNNKIRKFEKEIDALEKEIKEIDSNLADPEKFKELSQNPDFFANYEQKQLKLKDTEEFWEKSNLELDTLKQ